eukprot:1327928-Alexandrium_andersonii.AAC.1
MAVAHSGAAVAPAGSARGAARTAAPMMLTSTCARARRSPEGPTPTSGAKRTSTRPRTCAAHVCWRIAWPRWTNQCERLSLVRCDG